MREIDCKLITENIKKLCIDTNYNLPEDVENRICKCLEEEPYEIAKETLKNIKDNFEISKEGIFPICQDTGMACIFLEIGQDVHIINGNLTPILKDCKDTDGLVNIDKLITLLEQKGNETAFELWFVKLFSGELKDLVGLHVVAENDCFSEVLDTVGIRSQSIP